MANSAEDLGEAVRVLKQGFFADSNRAARAAREQEAELLLRTVAKRSDPFPLSSATLIKFSAALKAAGFKSAGAYVQVLKLLRTEKDYQVGPALQRTFDLCNRSLKRRPGTSRESPASAVGVLPAFGQSSQPPSREGRLPVPHLRAGAELHAPKAGARNAEGEGTWSSPRTGRE